MPDLVLSDASLHYQCQGEGDDVVLIHGLGANLAFWYMGIARALARGYRVTTYDLRGHGGSGMPSEGYRLPHMGADLEALLDHLGIRRAHVVGHSFGARVALFHAIQRPDRVATLTVADTQVSSLQPPMRLGDWPHWPRWKRQLQAQGHTSFPDEDEPISFQMLAHFNELSSEFAHGALNRRRGPAPSLRRRDMGLRGAGRWRRLMEATSAQRDFADDSPITPDGVASLPMPVLALFGEYSHCLGTCRRLKQLVPGCDVKILPGVGHFHPAIKPRLFVHVVRSFLGRHPISAAPADVGEVWDEPAAEIAGELPEAPLSEADLVLRGLGDLLEADTAPQPVPVGQKQPQ